MNQQIVTQAFFSSRFKTPFDISCWFSTTEATKRTTLSSSFFQWVASASNFFMVIFKRPSGLPPNEYIEARAALQATTVMVDNISWEIVSLTTFSRSWSLGTVLRQRNIIIIKMSTQACSLNDDVYTPFCSQSDMDFHTNHQPWHGIPTSTSWQLERSKDSYECKTLNSIFTGAAQLFILTQWSAGKQFSTETICNACVWSF
jgi:hypothetical protein